MTIQELFAWILNNTKMHYFNSHLQENGIYMQLSMVIKYAVNFIDYESFKSKISMLLMKNHTVYV